MFKPIRSLRSFYRFLHNDYHGFAAACHFESDYSGEPIPRFMLGAWLWQHISFLFNILVCKVRGHDWEDHGYAGPESGCIHMICQRCGESHRTVLY